MILKSLALSEKPIYYVTIIQFQTFKTPMEFV